MCGIVGALSYRGGAMPVARDVAENMCAAIKHRGPDDRGVHYAPPVFIGMQRLSIIDVAGGHQPIHNEDKTVWAVFNGEIYNFLSLRRTLESRGHRFYTNSDSECIVHAYEEYGDRCFEHFRGMFAIAIWDQKNQRLLLARDRLGKKPLYYAEVADGLIFGSELKSLLLVPGFNRQLSEPALRDYVMFGYVPTPTCIFDGVKKLPAATALVCEDGRISMRRYWTLTYEPKYSDGEQASKERLRDILEESVKLRLVSDVPFGAFLSGGLDSSVVVALMSRHMTRPVKTFSIGFEEQKYSELTDARTVAAFVGAEHHELVVKPEAVTLANRLAWYFDEPFADSSAIPTYLVAQMAVEHVKMVLSGDGGDECFAGYERYRKYVALSHISKGSRFGLGTGLRMLAGLSGRKLGKRLSWLAERMALPFPDNYLSGVALGTPAQVRELLSGSHLQSDRYSTEIGRHFSSAPALNDLDRVIQGDVETYLLDDILVKVDRATMANSLEARAPLLDHVLFEYAARLPVSLKMRHFQGKHLLRRVAADLLPASVLRKRKQGFAIPLAEWFRTSLRTMLGDLVSSRAFSERDVFDRGAVERSLRQHVAGEADHSERLWLVLMFELWARHFMDQQPGVVPGAGF
jgi:asparagine synthase (glutamine-hydrolysing)